MATLCTVGYGDISADTDSERALMIVMMLLGASCFAVIISNISALIASMRSIEQTAVENCDAVVEFLRSHGCPQELEKDVAAYYHYKASRQYNILDIDLMTMNMPTTLRNDVRFELMHEVLDAVPMLYVENLQIADSVKYYIASRLQFDVRMAGEIIYQTGDRVLPTKSQQLVQYPSMC